MSRIYISHRPEDSSRNEVAIIRERLIAEFGEDNILQSTGSNMEVTTNLQRLVWSCDVLLIVIGRYWANMVDERGHYLLEDPYDPIHVEVDAGLKSVMVVAVLVVDGVPIPKRNQLPEVLQPVLKKVTLEAPDHEHLERVLDELIPLWGAISTENLAADDPIDETIVAETTPEPEEPVSHERAREVRQANPPYQSPTQRRESNYRTRQHSGSANNESRSSSNTSYVGRVLMGLAFAFFSFLCNNLDNGRSYNYSSRNADRPAVAVSTQAPTLDPVLEELKENVRGTAQADRENLKTNSLDNLQDQISFNLLFEYTYRVEDIGFSPRDDILFTYEPLDDDSHIWFIRSDSEDDDPDPYPHDEDRSREVFDSLIKSSIKSHLDDTELAEFEAKMAVDVVFSAIDWTDKQVIVLSEEGIVFLLDKETLNLKSSYLLEHDEKREYIADETVVYDATNNLLMILTDENQITVWLVDDDTVEMVREFDVGTSRIHQIVVDNNGKYLATRTDENVTVYEIDINY